MTVMIRLTRQNTIRLARIVIPLGKQRNGSTAPEPATTLPPIEENVFELHIPVAMIEAALERHRQRPTPPKLAKSKPKKALTQFSIVLARIEMPVNPLPRKK